MGIHISFKKLQKYYGLYFNVQAFFVKIIKVMEIPNNDKNNNLYVREEKSWD